MSRLRRAVLRWLEGSGGSGGTGAADRYKAVAEGADCEVDFTTAFRGWHLVAQAEDGSREQPEAIMRSARALQMGDGWRAEAGHWEWLGNVLGRQTDEGQVPEGVLLNRYGATRGRERFAPFYVMSDEEWCQPIAAHTYATEVELARHRQAAAYQWAGECAAAAGQHDEATRLYRRAGSCWEGSSHPHNHQRAAACYYRAAMSASQSWRYQTRRRLFDGWCPSCLRDKAREEACGSPPDGHETPGDGNQRPTGDIDRLVACARKLFDSPDRAARRQQYQESERQLSVIQHRLASSGARSEAIRVYRKRRDFQRHYYWRVKSWRLPFTLLSWLLTGNGSRVKQVFLMLILTYIVICPVLWREAGAVRISEPGGRVVPSSSWPEAVSFSLSQIINLDTGHFAPGGTWMTLVQAMQGISAYFALGYVLWVAQRSYSS